MQSCFILKRRVWALWGWCGGKPQHLLPVALRRGNESQIFPLFQVPSHLINTGHYLTKQLLPSCGKGSVWGWWRGWSLALHLSSQQTPESWHWTRIGEALAGWRVQGSHFVSAVLLWCASVRFSLYFFFLGFLVLLQPMACSPPPPGPPVLEKFQPFLLSPFSLSSPSETLIVHVQPFDIVLHVSYILFCIF